MAAVEVDGLRVVHGNVVAVDGATFTAEAGAITCVLGPNGAGKTSTLEAVEGYRRPSGGRVRVLGLDPATHRRTLAPKVGVLLQDGGVQSGVRVGEALRHAAALYDHPLDVGDVGSRLGLDELWRRTWRHLSGGERKRVALALAVVGRPSVLLADEPTSGVDPAGRRQVRELLGTLRADGVAVLLTTHELDEAERTADRVVIIDRGRVVADGTPAALSTADAPEITFAAAGDLDLAALAAAIGVPVEARGAGRYVVQAEPTPSRVAALTAWLAEAGVAVDEIRTGRQRLEDAYWRITGGEA